MIEHKYFLVNIYHRKNNYTLELLDYKSKLKEKMRGVYLLN